MQEANTKPNKKEWYKQGWGLVVVILFLPYFVVWYAWAKSSWSKNIKIAVTAVVAIVMLPVIIAIATAEPPDTNNEQQATTVDDQPSEQTEAVEQPAPEPEQEAVDETEITARILIFGTGITIANQSGKEWKNCRVELNPGIIRGGYTQTLPILANDPDETGFSPNFMDYSNFTKRGERFNYQETKPESISIDCVDANGNRGFNYFGN